MCSCKVQRTHKTTTDESPISTEQMSYDIVEKRGTYIGDTIISLWSHTGLLEINNNYHDIRLSISSPFVPKQVALNGQLVWSYRGQEDAIVSLAESLVSDEMFKKYGSKGHVSSISSISQWTKVTCEVDNWQAIKQSGCYFTNPYTTNEISLRFQAKSAESSKAKLYWRPTQTPQFSENVSQGIAGFSLYGVQTAIQGGNIIPPIVTMVDVRAILARMDNERIADPFVVAEAESNRVKKLTQADFELLVTLAEGPETATYIKKRLLDFVKILNAFSRKNFKRYAKKTWQKLLKAQKQDGFVYDALSWFSAAWLELRFAVRPIVIDIDNALKLLDAPDKKPRHRIVGGASSTTQRDEGRHCSSGTCFSWHSKASASARSGCIVEETIPDPGRIDLGLSHVALALWEKIPFSFIIAYFVDVTQLLAALDFTTNFDTKVGWLSTKSQNIVTGSLYASDTSEEIKAQFSASSFEFSRADSAPFESAFIDDSKFDGAKLTDIITILFLFTKGHKFDDVIT